MAELTTAIASMLTAGGWLLFSYAYISIGEHQIHKNLMHRKRLPAWIYNASPYLLQVFEAHGIRHHTRWYRAFDYEPDPTGREENLEIPMKETAVMVASAFPLWSPIFLFSIEGGCIFLLTALAHNRLWSVLHRQMHIPKARFFSRWAIYRALARNHFMHHQDTRAHYNVVFPFADFIFGTRVRPRPADLREMLRLGILDPKSRRAGALVARRRAAIESRRRDDFARSAPAWRP